MDAAALLFVLGFVPPIDADPYIEPRLEGGDLSVINGLCIQHGPAIDGLLVSNKSKLLYHVKKLTGVYRLCIPPSVASDILAIAHEEVHPGFSYCYGIIACS